MTRTYSQMYRTDKYSQHSSIIWPVWLNGWTFVYEISDSGFEPSSSHLTSDFPSASSKEFLDSQATIECGWHDKITCSIFLLPLLLRFIEKVVQEQTMKFLSNNKVFYSYQYGFRSNHSTDLFLSFLVIKFWKVLAADCTLVWF